MNKNYLKLLVLLGVHLLILFILQFTAWPEMVSFPYFMNHGLRLYSDVVHVYPPLLVSVLSILYKAFGYNVLVLKIFGWFGFLVNDCLIFLLIKRITKKESLAIFSVLIYVLLQPILEGNMVWPDLFMIPFLLSGLIFLLDRKHFWSGIFFGLALLTKQTAILYIVCSLLYIVISKKRIENMARFFIGGFFIGLPFLINIVKQNSLQNFLNWVIIYPSKYWTKFPGYVQLSPSLRENFLLLVLFLPLAYFVFKSSKKIFLDKIFLLFFSFFVVGIIGVYPRFSFFHFQPGLVFLIIVIFYLIKNLKSKVVYSLLLIPCCVFVFSFHSLQFGGVRFWGETDLVLAKNIQSGTLTGKPIYLLGLNSNLYAFSNRLPNSPWLDNFGWYLEISGVQEEVIKGFEKNLPSTIFWQTPESGNWYDIGVYQPKEITDWIKENYVYKKEIQKGVEEWRLK